MQKPTGKSGGGLEPRVIQAIGGAAVITGLHAFALHVLGGSLRLVVGIGLLAVALAVWFCVAVVRRPRVVREAEAEADVPANKTVPEKRAAMYERKGRIFLCSYSQTVVGLSIMSDPIIVLEADEVGRLSQEIKTCLAASRSGIPHPKSFGGLITPLLKKAGVASYSTFATGASCVSIGDNGHGEVVFTPLRNEGARNGFTETEEIVRTPANGDLADAALQAMEIARRYTPVKRSKAVGATRRRKPSSVLDAGKELEIDGELLAALDACSSREDIAATLETKLAHVPDHAMARYLLALNHAEAARVDAAEEGLSATVATAPRFHLARLQLAQLLLSQERNEEAETELVPLSRMPDDDAIARYARGLLAISDHDPRKMWAEVEAALACRPGIPALAEPMSHMLSDMEADEIAHAYDVETHHLAPALEVASVAAVLPTLSAMRE